ncbi:MAG: hypothetical protein PUB99_04595 [Oscillospiraceae bacterium]|nr:hypothetical protein [Oscillospiraceae bacterium]
MAVTVMAAAARMEATMIAVMVFSPFTDFCRAQRVAIRVTTTDAAAMMMAVTMNSMVFLLSVFRSAGSDQGNDDGGGCQDGSDDDCGHFFVPLSFFIFGVLSVPLDTHTIPQPARNLCGL